MTLLRISIRKFSWLLAPLIIGSLLAGCSSEDPRSVSSAPPSQATEDSSHLRFDPLRIGDSIRVDFSGTPTPIPSIQTEIKGDGTIRLDFIGDVKADGKTPGELEKAIQAGYVPAYYTHLNVSVTPVARFFYVEGEINPGAGGKQLYTGQITVTRAIASAGDFSPFADRKHVRLYRFDGSMKTVNCIKALDDPKLDLLVYPGDKIVIKRRLW
jgi:polysaccharide biosynthesis/export protein VpsN